MRNLSLILLLLSIVSLDANPSKALALPAKQISIPILLPDGKPATSLKLTVSKRSLISSIPHLKTETATFQCDAKGLLQLPHEWTQAPQALVFDAPGYALHIQAWVPLQKIQLIKDGGIQGILIDQNGKLVKNTKICVSQSIGIIWGQIWIPKGINPTKTNDKGEFTLRQMVLNEVKYYRCYADVVRMGEQKKSPDYAPQMHLQFSGPNYRKPKATPRITLTQAR